MHFSVKQVQIFLGIDRVAFWVDSLCLEREVPSSVYFENNGGKQPLFFVPTLDYTFQEIVLVTTKVVTFNDH